MDGTNKVGTIQRAEIWPISKPFQIDKCFVCHCIEVNMKFSGNRRMLKEKAGDLLSEVVHFDATSMKIFGSAVHVLVQQVSHCTYLIQMLAAVLQGVQAHVHPVRYSIT